MVDRRVRGRKADDRARPEFKGTSMAELDGGSRNATATRAQIQRRIEAARGYLALEMFDHALGELDVIRQQSQYRFERYRLRGEALRGLNRWNDAVVAYMQALAERPQALPLLLAIAECYRRLGRLDRAMMALEEAYRIGPDEPAILYEMARLYLLSGNLPCGLPWLARAVQSCPDLAGLAEGDVDFTTIHDLPWFQQLLDAAAALKAY